MNGLMGVVLAVITWLAIIVFVIGIVVRAIRYARQPTHLRCEIYLEDHLPVEQGKPGRLAAELKFMSAELFLFKAILRRNRALWLFAYPLHLAVYLGVLWALCIAAGAVAGQLDVHVGPASSSLTGKILYVAPAVSGVAASLLGILGAGGLLIRRIVCSDLREYSTPAEYVNGLLLFLLFLTGFLSWYLADPYFHMARAFLTSLPTRSPYVPASPAFALFVTVLCAALLYMPFSSMMHFVAKYFIYHRVLWDDQPNLRGGPVEKTVASLLQQRTNWAAGHIGKGATWAELAQRSAPQDREGSGK